MKKIIIGLERLHLGNMHSPPCALDEGLRDQCFLLDVGLLPQLLTKALRNMPNCCDIEVRDFMC
jgi:hypothetical protein